MIRKPRKTDKPRRAPNRADDLEDYCGCVPLGKDGRLTREEAGRADGGRSGKTSRTTFDGAGRA
jgi:hypothetical protein